MDLVSEDLPEEMNYLAQKLEEFVGLGFSARNAKDYNEWKNRVVAFIVTVFGANLANEFKRLNEISADWEEARSWQVGMLEGLASKSLQPLVASGQEASPLRTPPVPQSKTVFVVHGHETETKESVARILDRIGLEPIILHEQPNAGRTIIEKFEVYSDVGFAVVLLTPDDVGALASEAANLKTRARQNVILELGYFLGRLTRSRVCALYKKGVEIPTDYQGVLYIELDPAGAWRTKVAQELVEAGFSIKLEKLPKS